MGLCERPYNPLHRGGFTTDLSFKGYPLLLQQPSPLPFPRDRVGLARLFTSLVWHHLSVPFPPITVTPLWPSWPFQPYNPGCAAPFSNRPYKPFPYEHSVSFTPGFLEPLLPCPQRHGPAFNGVCSLFIWRMAPCESITLLLFGPMVPLCLLLWPYVAFFLWLSWLYMASFMATTPAVPSLRLRLPCNLGIHYLLALTAPAFAVSGRFQPFLEGWGCSILSSACLSQHRSVDCVYSP